MKNIIVNNVGLRRFILSFFERILNLSRDMILITVGSKKKPKYIIITPRIFSVQILFDCDSRNFIKLRIRDNIDYGTFFQIFGNEVYGMDNLKRYKDLKQLFNNTKGTPLIIDCGGNIGLASRYFSEKYSGAKIICVEPNVENIRQARLNNSSKNIEFLCAAVGAENGKGDMIDPGLGNDAFRISSSANGEIPIVSITEILERYPATDFTPFIIKIDIEGYESDLFSHNLQWIEKFPLIIIELHDWMLPRGGTSKNFLQAIAKLDRDFVYDGENIFSIKNNF